MGLQEIGFLRFLEPREHGFHLGYYGGVGADLGEGEVGGGGGGGG